VRRTFIILAFVLSLWAGSNVANAVAQTEQLDRRTEDMEEQELETDRDAFTPATSTAGKRLAIVESSYSFIDNRRVAETHSFPEFLVRYGVSERIELRLGWNFEVGGAADVVSGGEGGTVLEGGGIGRESQMLYGAKVAVTEQNGWLPRSCTIVQGFTPTSGEATATDVVATYAFGWEMANRWRLDSSMRYGTEHEPGDTFKQWAPSIVLRVPINDRWNVHAEYFGIYSQGAHEDFSRAFFSPGTHYLLTPNLELGVRLGWGVTEDAPRFFSNVGIGWRF